MLQCFGPVPLSEKTVPSCVQFVICVTLRIHFFAVKDLPHIDDSCHSRGSNETEIAHRCRFRRHDLLDQVCRRIIHNHADSEQARHALESRALIDDRPEHTDLG